MKTPKTKIRSVASQALLVVAAATLMLFVNASSAAAYTLTPMVAILEPAGTGSYYSFLLDNPGSEFVAVELSMHGRRIDVDGVEQLISTDDFVLFPDQVILPPQGSQTVRVQYVGAADIDVEGAYRLYTRQLPVDLQEEPAADGGSLRVLRRYLASVYVRPRGARPDLALASVESNGAGRIVVTVQNDGSAHGLYAEPQLALDLPGDGPLVLDFDRLEALAARSILPGHSRRFVISTDAPIPAGTLAATLSERQR